MVREDITARDGEHEHGDLEDGVEHDEPRDVAEAAFDEHSEDAWGNENAAHDENPIVFSVLHALVNAGLGVPVEVTIVERGVVRIEGEAPSHDAKQKVEQVARAVRGVDDVVNDLVVRDAATP